MAISLTPFLSIVHVVYAWPLIYEIFLQSFYNYDCKSKNWKFDNKNYQFMKWNWHYINFSTNFNLFNFKNISNCLLPLKWKQFHKIQHGQPKLILPLCIVGMGRCGVRTRSTVKNCFDGSSIKRQGESWKDEKVQTFFVNRRVKSVSLYVRFIKTF